MNFARAQLIKAETLGDQNFLESSLIVLDRYTRWNIKNSSSCFGLCSDCFQRHLLKTKIDKVIHDLQTNTDTVYIE